MRSSRESSDAEPVREVGRGELAGSIRAAIRAADGTSISCVATWRSASAIRTSACRKVIASGKRRSRSFSRPFSTRSFNSCGTRTCGLRPMSGIGGSVSRLKTKPCWFSESNGGLPVIIS